MANRRGRDRARAINREHHRIEEQAWQIDQLRVNREDEASAAHRERLLRHAEECMGELTVEQQDVITATIMSQQSLSNWSMDRGTTYEAGRRMRMRGLEALGRCIKRKIESGREEGS